MKVKIHCLLVDGSTQDPEVELTFTYVSKKAEIKDMTWVVDASNKTATSEIVGPSVDEIKGQIKLSDPIVATIAYTDDKAMINGKVVQSYMDGSIQLKLVGLDKDGKPVSGTSEADIAKITKFVIQATFDEKMWLPYLILLQLNSKIRIPKQVWVMTFCMKLHSRLL